MTSLPSPDLQSRTSTSLTDTPLNPGGDNAAEGTRGRRAEPAQRRERGQAPVDEGRRQSRRVQVGPAERLLQPDGIRLFLPGLSAARARRREESASRLALRRAWWAGLVAQRGSQERRLYGNRRLCPG